MRKSNISAALAQFSPRWGDKKGNFEQMKRMIREAGKRNADLVIFPELSLTGYNPKPSSSEINKFADQPLASNYISKLQSIASLHSISVVFGTLVKAGQRAYNAVIWLEGDQLFRYNKTHVHWTENFIPGDDFPVFESELTKAGALSCFDLGFPEASRSLVLKGAEIIVAPSLVPADFKDINKKRVVARALDNQIFVIYCNYAGGGHSGGSLIADPGGDILMEADDKPGIFIKNIDLNRIGQWRKKELLFQNRRPEIYKIW